MTHLTVREWGRVEVGDGGFTRSQANSLLNAARNHQFGGVDGTDILSDHYRFLRTRQAVGVIAGGGCSLEILPKVDPESADELDGTVRSRLVHMLDVALGLEMSAGEATAMSHRAESLLDIFIALFANRLLAEVRRGLPRQYLPHQEDLTALRGRLDTFRQFTINAVRPDRLACRFDALDSDVPLMQVMKACVLFVERHARGSATRRKLTELRFLFADVANVAPRDLPWRKVRIDRTSHRWRALLDLAKLLLGLQWQQTHAERSQPDGITLLFPMNDLFERYIAIQLRRALVGSGLDVVAQGGLERCLGPWREGENCIGDSHSTRPDILVRQKGQVLAVIDTKWKLRSKGIAQGDVYQMMAYARLYQCERLLLLYPAVPGEADSDVEPRGLAKGTERLDVAGVSLESSAANVVDELRRMTEAIGLVTNR